MKNEPIPVLPTRPPRKSKGGIKVAGAVAAGVLALGGGAGALAANHVGAQAGEHSGSGATAEPEQSLPASDLFGVTKPGDAATPEATPEPVEQPVVTMPAPPATTSSHETEHETEHESGSGTSSGGDD